MYQKPVNIIFAWVYLLSSSCSDSPFCNVDAANYIEYYYWNRPFQVETIRMTAENKVISGRYIDWARIFQ